MTLDVTDLWTALDALTLVARAPNLPDRDKYEATSMRIRAEIEADSGGPCVFTMSLPLDIELSTIGAKRLRKPVKLRLAPSLNEYASMLPWTLKLTRAVIDQRIEAAKAAWPRWDCGSHRVRTVALVKRGKRTVKVEKLNVSGGRKRILEVVRYSSRQVDELAVDIIGGKLAVDRLTWAGVIAGDAVKHIVRRPRWVAVKPGEGRLEIAVYEIVGRPAIA